MPDSALPELGITNIVWSLNISDLPKIMISENINIESFKFVEVRFSRHKPGLCVQTRRETNVL